MSFIDNTQILRVMSRRNVHEGIWPMMKIGEVARLLDVHENTIRRWSNQGIIASYRLPGRGDRRFRLADITRLMSHLEGNGDDGMRSGPIP